MSSLTLPAVLVCSFISTYLPAVLALLSQVVLLLRDPYLCKDINEQHCNTRYLKVLLLLLLPRLAARVWWYCCCCHAWELVVAGGGHAAAACLHACMTFPGTAVGPAGRLAGLLLMHLPAACRPLAAVQDFKLPSNVSATTSAPVALLGAQCAIHAVPVQVDWA